MFITIILLLIHKCLFKEVGSRRLCNCVENSWAADCGALPKPKLPTSFQKAFWRSANSQAIIPRFESNCQEVLLSFGRADMAMIMRTVIEDHKVASPLLAQSTAYDSSPGLPTSPPPFAPKVPSAYGFPTAVASLEKSSLAGCFRVLFRSSPGKRCQRPCPACLQRPYGSL